jgi:hypothetical protein
MDDGGMAMDDMMLPPTLGDRQKAMDEIIKQAFVKAKANLHSNECLIAPLCELQDLFPRKFATSLRTLSSLSARRRASTSENTTTSFQVVLGVGTPTPKHNFLPMLLKGGFNIAA